QRSGRVVDRTPPVPGLRSVTVEVGAGARRERSDRALPGAGKQGKRRGAEVRRRAAREGDRRAALLHRAFGVPGEESTADDSADELPSRLAIGPGDHLRVQAAGGTPEVRGRA